MTPAQTRTRDYAGLASACRHLTGDRLARMSGFVDAAWAALASGGVSWLGFYLTAPQNAESLVLGPRRDKPACSPIGLHGACGRSFTQGLTLVVPDVAALGEGYIACDPRDVAELVIPLFDESAACWGVLDLDSYSHGAFTAHDANALHACLVAAGLTSDKPPPVVVVTNHADRTPERKRPMASAFDREIEDIFQQLGEQGADPEEPLHWIFHLALPEGQGDDRAQELSQLADATLGDSDPEDGGFFANPAHMTDINEDSREETITIEVAVQVVAAMGLEEVKSRAARVEAFARANGLTPAGVDATDPSDMDDLMDWMTLEDAQWQLSHHTDAGLEAGAPVPWVFAIDAQDTDVLDSVRLALDETGLGRTFFDSMEDPEGDDDDEPEEFLFLHVEGVNDNDRLADCYQRVEAIVARGGAELLGVQYIDVVEDGDDEPEA
ncbi:MAG: hypothetical protein KIT54_08700 [Phycisphaeraceae bacterium]|nr:hypothetical protein [Phycisphaeraceae bacterium]